MAARLLRFTRPALLRAAELERIEGTALRILEEIGIEVSHPDLAARARRHGFKLQQGRIRLSRRQVASFLREARKGRHVPRRQPPPRETDAQLMLGVSSYPQSVHDPETDRILSFTTARLVEATKLVDMLGDRGLYPGPPGCPTDVPPPLQVLMQYRIAAENLRRGGDPVDPKDCVSLPYLMEMAQTMGHPITGLPVYVFSPLKLAGESLSAVLMVEKQLQATHVSSMPAAGCAAPVRPAEALALATAEVVGSALILRECLKPAVHWSVAAYAFDLRGMAMSSCGPEGTLFKMASAEVDAYLHGQEWFPGIGRLHTLAKLPDSQAAAEKASAMTVGALCGARSFSNAGALSHDEIFSAVQLLVDLEIQDHVQRLVQGLDTACDEEACLADVRAALGRGFLGLDRTLELYRDLYWHPQLFERRFLSSWQAASHPTLSREAQEMAKELISRHDYELPLAKRADLDRIYRRAERELTGR